MSQIDVYEKDKTAPVSKYVYIWDNDKLIARQIISYDPQDNGLIMTSRIIYDAEDEPQGFILLGEQNGESTGQQVFLYRKNLQGDITGIIDSLSGQLLADYSYDAYGNPKLIVNNNDFGAALLGAITTAYNPLLYRGYVYTNLGGEFAYYLGSRFYVPQLGRFLNADKPEFLGIGISLVNCNIFAYCNNDPVMRVDPYGNISFRPGIYTYTNINDYFGPDDYVYNPKLKPTLKNKFMLSTWKTLATMLKPSCPDGYAFYMHYITGNGKPYFYDYSKAIKDDADIKKEIDGMIEEFKLYIKKQNLKDGITYEFSSILDEKVGVKEPKTLNWKLALGRHLIVMTAQVKYFKSENRYNAIIVIGAYDRYNFSSTGKFMGIIPGSWNGELVACGLAKNFLSCGIAIKSVSWR